MATCIFINTGTCWKTEAQLATTSSPVQTLWASGNCTACLIANTGFGFTNSKVRILHGPDAILLSGSRIQVSGYM